MAQHEWIAGQPVQLDNTIFEWIAGSPNVLYEFITDLVKIIDEALQINETISFKEFIVKSYARLDKRFDFKARLDIFKSKA